MEAWKVLLLVAVLPTIASIALSFMNKATLLETIETRSVQETKVAEGKEALEKAKEELAKMETDARNLEQEAELMGADLIGAKTGITEQELLIQSLTDQIGTADTKIAKFDELKRLFGEIDAVNRKDCVGQRGDRHPAKQRRQGGRIPQRCQCKKTGERNSRSSGWTRWRSTGKPVPSGATSTPR